jgi:hypothetical protein
LKDFKFSPSFYFHYMVNLSILLTIGKEIK